MRRNDITKKIMTLTTEANNLIENNQVLKINSEFISKIFDMKITKDYLDTQRGYYILEYTIDKIEFTYTFEDLCNYNVFKATDNITEINSRSAKLNVLHTIYKIDVELVVNFSYKFNDKYVEKDVIIKTWKIAQHKDTSRIENRDKISQDNVLVKNILDKYKETNNTDKCATCTYSNNTCKIINSAIEKEFKYRFNNSIPSDEFKNDIIDFMQNSFKDSFVEMICRSGFINNCISVILSNV